MSGTVTPEMLMSVVHIMTECLSQNGNTAEECIEQVRRFVQGEGSSDSGAANGALKATPAIKGKQSNGIAQKGGKRARQESDEDTMEGAENGAAPAGKQKGKKGAAPKKARKINPHTAFMVYGSKGQPFDAAQKIKDHAGSNTMVVLNEFKKACTQEDLDRFIAEMEPVLAEVNADEGRKAGDNARLLELMKARDAAERRKVHPLFKKFEAFIEREGPRIKGEADKKKAAKKGDVEAPSDEPDATVKVHVASKAQEKPHAAAPAPAGNAAAAQQPAESSEEESSSDDSSSDDEQANAAAQPAPAAKAHTATIASAKQHAQPQQQANKQQQPAKAQGQAQQEESSSDDDDDESSSESEEESD